jgi:hypothetical protein
LRPQAKSLTAHQVSNHQDPARLIAERVARRLAAGATATDHRQTDSTSGQDTAEPPRARVIDFVSATPPPVRRSFGSQDSRPSTPPPSESRHLPVTQVAQSPWLAPFRQTLGPSPEFGNQLDVVAHPRSSALLIPAASPAITAPCAVRGGFESAALHQATLISQSQAEGAENFPGLVV